MDVRKPEIVFLLQHAGAIRFIENFCRDLYGVLNISNILYRNCARSRAPLWAALIFRQQCEFSARALIEDLQSLTTWNAVPPSSSRISKP